MAPVISLERDPETPEVMAKAKEELRDTPENRAAGFKELTKLIQDGGKLSYATREDILLRYLRPTKFYPESAYALMIREAEFKKKNLDTVTDANPDKLKAVLDNEECPVNILANRDQFGRRVLIAHVGKKWKTSDFSNKQIFQSFYLIHQGALLEPATQVNGVVVILDFLDLGLKQVANLTPNFAVLLLSFIQEAMPLRLKAVHIVNEPALFKTVWKIFQPLIKEKLNKRLYFHGSNMDSLHKHIDPNFLPADYSGKLPAIDYSAKNWYPFIKQIESSVQENSTFQLIKK